MKVIRTADVPWADALQRGNYSQRRKGLVGEKLSAGLWELAPGKKSFPMHAHQVTEEALYVISGRGKVRTPEQETAIGPGDWISFPAGGTAHQLINDGTEPLVYLGLGVGQAFDIVDYPETGKVAVRTGVPPTGRRMIFKADAQVDYFEGDKDAG